MSMKIFTYKHICTCVHIIGIVNIEPKRATPLPTFLVVFWWQKVWTRKKYNHLLCIPSEWPVLTNFATHPFLTLTIIINRSHLPSQWSTPTSLGADPSQHTCPVFFTHPIGKTDLPLPVLGQTHPNIHFQPTPSCWQLIFVFFKSQRLGGVENTQWRYEAWSPKPAKHKTCPYKWTWATIFFSRRMAWANWIEKIQGEEPSRGTELTGLYGLYS